MSRNIQIQLLIILSFLFSGLMSSAEARRSVSHTSVHTNNRSVSRTSVHTNRNVHVDRHVDVNVHGHHHGCCHHPVATAAAVTATAMVTAAVVGSIVHSLPPSCSTMVINGIAYQQCGSSWYQPQYAGSSVQYVVINPPR